MLAILSLIVILAFSFLVTRIATVALSHTGLSREVARFQARSALTGAGFTTSESERLVNHPVRRRILMLLMLVGNAGIITAVSSLILAFIGQEEAGSLWIKVVLLITGLVGLWTLASSRWVDRHLSRMIDKALSRYTTLQVQDVASLLGLSGSYRIVEMMVNENHWLAEKTLADARLQDEGVLVLAIQKADGGFFGTPDRTTRIEPEDTLILYGHVDSLQALDARQADALAESEHRRAAARHRARAQEERREGLREG